MLAQGRLFPTEKSCALLDKNLDQDGSHVQSMESDLVVGILKVDAGFDGTLSWGFIFGLVRICLENHEDSARRIGPLC